MSWTLWVSGSVIGIKRPRSGGRHLVWLRVALAGEAADRGETAGQEAERGGVAGLRGRGHLRGRRGRGGWRGRCRWRGGHLRHGRDLHADAELERRGLRAVAIL